MCHVIRKGTLALCCLRSCNHQRCSCLPEASFSSTTKPTKWPVHPVKTQIRHPPSLIRDFAVHLKKAWVLSYPLSAQRRLWSDSADAQDDLSLYWAHMPFCFGFVMRQLNYCVCDQWRLLWDGHLCDNYLFSWAGSIIAIFYNYDMSPTKGEVDILYFGADPVGVGVRVSISGTLSCLHNISWTSGWILTTFAWM